MFDWMKIILGFNHSSVTKGKTIKVIYEGCSEIIEILAVNKLLKKLQVLFLVFR